MGQQQQFVNDVVVQLQREKGRSIHGTRRETEREIAITHIIIINFIQQQHYGERNEEHVHVHVAIHVCKQVWQREHSSE